MNTTLTKIELAGEVLDLTDFAQEQTLLSESAAIQAKIDNIKLPEIDTTELAKQGENQEATMSAVLEEVMKLNGSFAEQIHNIVGE